MKMLSVCSATPTGSSHFQITSHGQSRPFSPFKRYSESRCNLEERVVFGLSGGSCPHRLSFKTQAIKAFLSDFVGTTENSLSMDFINSQSCRNELDDINCVTTCTWDLTSTAINELQPFRELKLGYADNSVISSLEDRIDDIADQSTESGFTGSLEPETVTSITAAPQNAMSLSSSQAMGTDQLSSLKTEYDNFFAGASNSINASLNKGEDTVKKSLDTVTSSLSSITKSSSEVVDTALSKVFSSLDHTGEFAASRLASFSSDVKEASSKASVLALDLLRGAVISVEDLITKGASVVVFSYGSLKELFPTDIKEALSSSEEKAFTILRPVGTSFQQVNIYIKGLEKNLGFDPNDPLVPFVIFLGVSTTLWIFYRIWVYSGYAGDLSPELTLELLTKKENGVLIDVRPEVLREKDGVPDLRRAARSHYASVTLPRLDGMVRKLLKSGKELDDILIATVIKNLKSVQDRSKVIVMDADGTSSKSIARCLRKLGVKRSYRVEGGYQSWTRQGLRYKELKPETTFTILNEDAEAILEDISPSAAQVVGYGLGVVTAWYALLEWEKSLQVIGFIGLGQTIYKRVASYDNAEDFKQDVSMLLAPFKVGAQAFAWAAGRLETNGFGLPTSPSSLDVQNRVLQAAAKHESQPSDTEGIQISSPNENADLSEA